MPVCVRCRCVLLLVLAAAVGRRHLHCHAYICICCCCRGCICGTRMWRRLAASCGLKQRHFREHCTALHCCTHMSACIRCCSNGVGEALACCCPAGRTLLALHPALYHQLDCAVPGTAA